MAVVRLVIESEIGVEAETVVKGGDFIIDECVAKREKRIHRVGGRVTVPCGEGKRVANHFCKGREVGAGGNAFVTEEHGHVGLRRHLAEKGRQRPIFIFQRRLGVIVLELAEELQGVSDLSLDYDPRETVDECGIPAPGILGLTKNDVLGARGCDLAEEPARACEERHFDAALQQESHSLCRELDVAENHHPFDFTCRNVGKDCFILLDNEAMARSPQHCSLLGDV